MFEFAAHALQKGDHFTDDFGDNWWHVDRVSVSDRCVVVGCTRVCEGVSGVTTSFEFEKNTLLIVSC